MNGCFRQIAAGHARLQRTSPSRPTSRNVIGAASVGLGSDLPFAASANKSASRRDANGGISDKPDLPFRIGQLSGVALARVASLVSHRKIPKVH
jgi:hypothetical protein